MFTGGGEQVHLASNVALVLDVWLEWFGRHLTSVDVDGHGVHGVVLGVEWVFSIIPVVGVIVDTPKDESFRYRPEEEVL